MNLKKFRLLSLLVPLLILVMVLPVMAAIQTPMLVTTGLDVALNTTSLYGICPQPYTNTFYAQGRVWVFYLNNDEDFVYRSAVPGGAFNSERTIVAGTGLYAVEFCVWYDDSTNRVHYARHDMDPNPDEVVYRMGRPRSTGTIAWSTAEQTVSTTPAALVTWRTVISVDETGDPWVAWIDTNNVTGVGIVYIEASSTGDGTWTQNADVSSNWSVADPALNETHAWFVNLCPIGPTGDLMHLGWTSENQTSNATGLYGVTFNISGNTSGIQTIAAGGTVYHDRPDGFDFYDLATDVYVVYTDNTGAVVGGSKNTTQTWVQASTYFGFVKEDVGLVWLPTLSGYAVNGTGEDLLCIVHDHLAGDAIYSGLNYYGNNITVWSWTLAVNNTDTNDYISRHNADYKYGSPIVFAWQVTDNSDTPDTDDAYLWWQDNSNDQIGYYSATATPASNNLLRVILPIAVAVGVVLAVILLAGVDSPMKLVGAAVIGVVVFIALRALVDALL